MHRGDAGISGIRISCLPNSKHGFLFAIKAIDCSEKDQMVEFSLPATKRRVPISNMSNKDDKSENLISRLQRKGQEPVWFDKNFGEGKVGFDLAVAKVKNYLVEIDNARISYDFGDEAFNALELSKSFGPENKNLIMYVEWLLENELETWIQAALEDRNAYDTLLFCAGHLLTQDKQLPTTLSFFLANHLLAPSSPPGKEGGQKTSEWYVNYRKWFCINIAVETGLKATRSETSNENSACDAVVKAARELKLGGFGYSTLAKIWAKRDSYDNSL